jgi:hypothetical protein
MLMHSTPVGSIAASKRINAPFKVARASCVSCRASARSEQVPTQVAWPTSCVANVAAAHVSRGVALAGSGAIFPAKMRHWPAVSRNCSHSAEHVTRAGEHDLACLPACDIRHKRTAVPQGMSFLRVLAASMHAARQAAYGT